MGRLLKRPLAEADLDDIWWYIAQDNPDAADRFLTKIDEQCHALAQFPEMGTSKDDLMPSPRSFPVGNYLIFICQWMMALKLSEPYRECEA